MQDYNVNELISWRLIDGQILILDSHLNESAHELNEVGSFIFTEISEGKSTSTIYEALKGAYPESLSDLEKDINTFLNELQNLKLIVPK